MAATVTIGRRTCVMGLHWVVHDTMPSWKAMRELAQKEGRWVTRRRGKSIIQTGYMAPIPGVRPQTLVPLAALVADAEGEPWLGIFDLGDGRYWFIAVRDNNGILPDGDFVGTREEVADARARADALGSWTYADGGIVDLERMAGEGRAEAMRDAQVRPWVIPAVAGGILVAGVVGGTSLWQAHEAHVKADEIARIARARALQAALQAKETRYLMPWEQTAEPGTVARACLRGVRRIPTSWEGWQPVQVVCRPDAWSTQVQTTLVTTPQSRETGLAIQTTWVPGPGGTTLMTPPGHLNTKGTQVTTHRRIPVARDGRPRIVSEQQALRTLYGTLRPLGWVVQAKTGLASAHAPVLPGSSGPAHPATSPHPWRVLQVTITAGSLFDQPGIASLLDAVPGLRVTGLQSSHRTGAPGSQWTLQAQLYVLRPPSAAPKAPSTVHPGVGQPTIPAIPAIGTGHV